MAGTANISSSFVIKFDPSNTAATTITNPGRTFRVVGIGITNTTGGAVNVTVTDGTNNITNGGAFSAADNSTTWSDLDTANVEIASDENLVVTCANAGVEVYILCVASSGGQSLTAT
ncbi:hypothetical protein K0U83_03245 [bacterium]|nr:hypothetical protein [bacterium]